MSRAAPLKQADLKRMVKALLDAGFSLGEVIVTPDGEARFRVKPDGQPDNGRPNSLDLKYGA